MPDALPSLQRRLEEHRLHLVIRQWEIMMVSHADAEAVTRHEALVLAADHRFAIAGKHDPVLIAVVIVTVDCGVLSVADPVTLGLGLRRWSHAEDAAAGDVIAPMA